MFKKVKFDELTFDMAIEITESYKSLSKYKRVRVPVIDATIHVFVNGIRLNEDEDEVFVVEQFFDSLLTSGKIPMYTCSCGIFGCGGFYVNVNHHKKTIEWFAEQSKKQKYMFTTENIQLFAERLIEKLTEFSQLRQDKGLQPIQHDLEKYRSLVERFVQAGY